MDRLFDDFIAMFGKFSSLVNEFTSKSPWSHRSGVYLRDLKNRNIHKKNSEDTHENPRTVFEMVADQILDQIVA